MLVYREAMIKIANYQRVNQLQLRQEQSQQPQRVHGAKRVGRVRLQQRLLQVQPQLCSPGRRRGQRWKRLLDAKLGGSAQLQTVVGHEVKKSEQDFRVLQRRRLLQKNEAIHHGKVWRRKPDRKSTRLN